jgi:hypothetical protein
MTSKKAKVKQLADRPFNEQAHELLKLIKERDKEREKDAPIMMAAVNFYTNHRIRDGVVDVNGTVRTAHFVDVSTEIDYAETGLPVNSSFLEEHAQGWTEWASSYEFEMGFLVQGLVSIASMSNDLEHDLALFRGVGPKFLVFFWKPEHAIAFVKECLEEDA